jgi:hypothetical protein
VAQTFGKEQWRSLHEALTSLLLSEKKSLDIVIIKAVIISGAVALVTLGASGLGAAQDQDAGRREMQKAFDALSPHPSLSTEPVRFSVNGVRFEFPRNYIKSMDDWAGGPQEIVTLSLNTVDLQPRTAANIGCFTAAPADRGPDCKPLDVNIEFIDVETPQRVKFNRRSVSWRNKDHPFPGPDGFERYQLGRAGMSDEDYNKNVIEAYKKQDFTTEYFEKENDSNFLEAECSFYTDAAGSPTGSCSTSVDLHDGTCLFFFFHPSLMAHFTDLTSRLRAFMQGHEQT